MIFSSEKKNLSKSYKGGKIQFILQGFQTASRQSLILIVYIVKQ